ANPGRGHPSGPARSPTQLRPFPSLVAIDTHRYVVTRSWRPDVALTTGSAHPRVRCHVLRHSTAHWLGQHRISASRMPQKRVEFPLVIHPATLHSAWMPRLAGAADSALRTPCFVLPASLPPL